MVLNALSDPLTEDIVLNPDSQLWVKKLGSGFVRIGEMSASQAQTAIGTIAAQRATVVNYDRPILETELPIDGSRFEGIIPPVVSRPVFAIRLRPRRIFTLDDYETNGILSIKSDCLNQPRRLCNFAAGVQGLSHAEIIRAAIQQRKNILIVGSTGSGKTTLVNAILESIARLSPTDRVISIEDTMELQCPVPNYVDLRAVGSVSMLDCLRACMRLKPTRIVVGEVRGAEAHVMLKSWNSDLPGEVRALVRENVYDTATGQYLLIPQGARLVGVYDSRVAYGQDGMMVVWNRIIFPDGSSINLEGMTGQDARGQSGFRDRVDNHYGRLFGFAALTSAFSAAFQLSQSRRGTVLGYPSPGEVAGSAAGREISQLGAQMMRRNLNVQPTLKVPIGYRFNVRLNRDLLFESVYIPG